MKAEDLEAQIKRTDYSPPVPSPPPFERAGLAGKLVMDEAALVHAKKFGLVRQDGTVKCINDRCNGDAQLPTLECMACRKRRTGA